jgi:hypothetical protein
MNWEKIFTATDPEGRNIVFHSSTWDHIKEGHPEVKDIQEIKLTIQKPHFITQDSSRKSLAYSRSRSILSPIFNVFTKMDDMYKEGRVTTAFIMTELPKGDVIWTDQT